MIHILQYSSSIAPNVSAELDLRILGSDRAVTPSMTGNGKTSTYKNADDWGMVYICLWHCFNHWKKNTSLGPFKVGLFFIIKEKLADGSWWQLLVKLPQLQVLHPSQPRSKLRRRTGSWKSWDLPELMPEEQGKIMAKNRRILAMFEPSWINMNKN